MLPMLHAALTGDDQKCMWFETGGIHGKNLRDWCLPFAAMHQVDALIARSDPKDAKAKAKRFAVCVMCFGKAKSAGAGLVCPMSTGGGFCMLCLQHIINKE